MLKLGRRQGSSSVYAFLIQPFMMNMSNWVRWPKYLKNLYKGAVWHLCCHWSWLQLSRNTTNRSAPHFHEWPYFEGDSTGKRTPTIPIIYFSPIRMQCCPKICTWGMLLYFSVPKGSRIWPFNNKVLRYIWL